MVSSYVLPCCNFLAFIHLPANQNLIPIILSFTNWKIIADIYDGEPPTSEFQSYKCIYKKKSNNIKYVVLHIKQY